MEMPRTDEPSEFLVLFLEDVKDFMGAEWFTVPDVMDICERTEYTTRKAVAWLAKWGYLERRMLAGVGGWMQYRRTRKKIPASARKLLESVPSDERWKPLAEALRMPVDAPKLPKNCKVIDNGMGMS